MRYPLRILTLLYCAAALSAGVVSTSGFALAQPAPVRKPPPPERLVMPLFPAGWTEVFKNSGPVEIIEYIPNGQTGDAWQDKIVLQVYHNLNNLPLDAIQRRAQGQNRNRCVGVIEGPLQSGLNNGTVTLTG